jgi:virginiamycin A acetyltransferase
VFKRIINKIRTVFDSRRSQPYRSSFENVEIQEGSNISEDCKIGSFTYIGFNCTVTKSEIGRYCSIANNVSIGIGEHRLEKVSTSSIFYDNPYEVLTQKKCTIGNDVWIGTNSVIRRGVRIGDGAVVGANSFVNRDVPDFAVCAGSPAKILKYRFNESQIGAIRNSKWWELDVAEAKTVIMKLEETFKNTGC